MILQQKTKNHARYKHMLMKSNGVLIFGTTDFFKKWVQRQAMKKKFGRKNRTQFSKKCVRATDKHWPKLLKVKDQVNK